MLVGSISSYRRNEGRIKRKTSFLWSYVGMLELHPFIIYGWNLFYLPIIYIYDRLKHSVRRWDVFCRSVKNTILIEFCIVFGPFHFMFLIKVKNMSMLAELQLCCLLMRLQICFCMFVVLTILLINKIILIHQKLKNKIK